MMVNRTTEVQYLLSRRTLAFTRFYFFRFLFS